MKIEHIAIYVQNLEQTKDFYTTYFGGKSGELYHNQTTGFRSYFITFDTGARLEIMSHPQTQNPEKDTKRTGFIHLAFSVGSKEKVDMLTQKLANDGFVVLSGPRTTGDGYYESCILDTEQNQIEITQ